MKFLLFFAVLLCAFSAHGNLMPYNYTIGYENGLPTLEINHMVQDETGYIYLATEAGLYRYDGQNFEPITHPDLHVRSMSLLEYDSEKNLWCANNKGQLFRVLEDSLLLVFQYQGPSDQFRFCFFDGPGLWLFEAGKMSWISPSGTLGTSIPLPFLQSEDLSDLKCIRYKQSLLIEANGKGLFVVDLKTRAYSSIPYPEKSRGKKHFERSLFILDKKLFLVLGDEYPLIDGNIFWVDLSQHKLKNVFHYINPLRIVNYDYRTDRKKRLWIISSYGAICIWDIRAFTSPEHIFFFQNKISCMLEDREGALWFADPAKGLLVVPNENVFMFEIRGLKPYQEEVKILLPLVGNELIGGDANGNIFRYTPGIPSLNYISPEWGKSLMEVSDIKVNGDTCIAAQGMISLFDYTGKFHKHFENYGAITDLECDNQYLWATDHKYLFRAPMKNLIQKQELVFDTLLQCNVKGIGLEPFNRNLFFSQSDGLAYIDSSGKLHEPEYGKGLDVKHFFSEDSSLFLATYNRGLIEIQNGKIKHTWLDGKTINQFTSADQRLWVSTEKELFTIEKQSGKVLLMTINGGIRPSEISFISHYKQNAVLLTKKAIIMVPDSTSFVNHNPPGIIIKSVYTDKSHFKLSEKIVLPYDFANLRIAYIGFSYTSGKAMQYAYRLIGLDTNWTQVSAEQTTALFPSLPNGEYVFEIKAINESKTESRIVRIPFTVNSPFWMKWWFYILIVLCIGGFVALFFQLRIRRLQRKNSLEKKMIASQLTALKAQMNPHFMYNALNSIQDLILANDHVNSNKYLVRFSTLMRKVLDVSGKENITLQEEIDILSLYLELEKLRFGDEFIYTIRCENIHDTESVDVPPMILQPFVENAMKHGLFHKKGEKKLDIEFVMKEHLVCNITDNGVGRKRAEEIRQRKHHSFASKAIEQRISLLNEYTSREYRSEIVDLFENGEAAGTKVIVHFPVYSDQ